MYNALYTPVLQTKQGELDAVAWLSSLCKARCRPLFDVTLPRPDASLELHVTSAMTSVAKAWGTQRPFYLDASLLGQEHLSQSGEHAAFHLFNAARQLRLRPIPVVAALDLRPSAYFEAAISTTELVRNGAAIRLIFEDWHDAERLPEIVTSAIEKIRLNASDVDLILDAGALEHLAPEECNEDALTSALVAAMLSIKEISFREVIFVASSLPKFVPRSENWKPTEVERVEFSVWNRVAKAMTERRLLFGDYAATHATFSDPTGKSAIPPSRVRIVTSKKYFLFKSTRANHRRLCTVVRGTKEFLAQPDCWGRREIRDCAIGSGGIGRPTDWVARDTNAHIECTTRDAYSYARNYPGFSGMRYVETSPEYSQQQDLMSESPE